MYNSQYYTCEQIDQRLLQGYLDDYNTENNTSLTKAQFLSKLGSILSVWQGVDNEPTAGSDNLVKSGGINKYFRELFLSTTLYDRHGNPTLLEHITKTNGVFVLANGNLSYGAAYAITDYIYIKGCNKINWHGYLPTVSNAVAAVAFYDKDKVCISSISVGNDSSGATYNTEQTNIEILDIPSNAVYIRCSTRSTTNPAFAFYVRGDFSGIDLLRNEIKENINAVNENINAVNENINAVNENINAVNENIQNITANKLPPFVKSLILNGAESSEGLYVRYAFGSAFSIQIKNANDTILCYHSFVIIDQTEDTITINPVNSVNLQEYNSSGVTATITFIDTISVLPKSILKRSYIDLVLPEGVKYPLITSLNNKLDKTKIINALNTPDFSWVDDDFAVSGVRRVKAICDNLGCKCDFALIPEVSGGTGDYPTDYTFEFSQSNVDRIVSIENDGYHIENHPVHRGWYSSQSAGTYQGRAYTEYLLVSGLRLFKQNFILGSNCVVYPGNSGDNQEVVEMCRSHLDYGIKSSGTYNVGPVDPMTLQRLFINLSSTKTKTYYKNLIQEAYDNGAWLILGTHSVQYEDSEIVDETSKTTANLKEIIEYANNLSTIRPVSEIYRKRKQMLDLYNIT